jgi:hypothetical protein
MGAPGPDSGTGESNNFNLVVHRLSPTHGWMKRAEGAGAFRPLNAAIGYDGL